MLLIKSIGCGRCCFSGAQAEKLRPLFDRAVRRLFRIYDLDRDGLLGDNELNAFQYTSFQLYLSDEDIGALKRVSVYFASSSSSSSPQDGALCVWETWDRP